MGAPSVAARWTAFVARQTAQWKADKVAWRHSVLLKCPLAAACDDDGIGTRRGSALIARLVIGLLTFAIAMYLFLNAMVTDEGMPYYFLYLTNWTGFISGVYGVLAAYAAVDCYYDWSKPTQSPSEVPRFVHVLWALKAIAPAAQLLITLLYWVLLYPGSDKPISPATGLAHGLCAGVLLVDYMCLNRFTVGSLYDIVNVYLFCVAYIVFDVVWTLAIHYVYAILSWGSDPGGAMITTLAVLVVVVPLVWGAVCGVTTLRDTRLFPVAKEREYMREMSEGGAPDIEGDRSSRQEGGDISLQEISIEE